MVQSPHKVVKTANGLVLNTNGRVSIYDVMELYEEGDNIYQIGMVFNLSPMQVQTMVDYIEEHRETLIPALQEALCLKVERERYWRTVAAERAKIPVPVTPQRENLQALLDKYRQEIGINGTVSS